MGKKIALFLITVALVLTSGILAVSADEGNAVPSITAKDAPTVVVHGGGSGSAESIAADIVYRKTGAVYKSLTDTEVHILSYADRENVSDAFSEEERKAITENLEKAYDEIVKSSDLGELNKDLDDAAKIYGKDYNATGLVAYQLFDLSITEEYRKELEENDELALRVTFNKEFTAAGTLPLVIHRNDGKWEVLSAEDVVLEEDGTFTVFFDDLCPVSFLKADQSRLTDQPHRGFHPVLIVLFWLWILLLLIVLAIYLYRRYRKKKREQAENG